MTIQYSETSIHHHHATYLFRRALSPLTSSPRSCYCTSASRSIQLSRPRSYVVPTASSPREPSTKMPTPNATVVSLPAAINISSPRQTCPPEEERMFDRIIELENASDNSDGSPESVDSEAHSRTTPATTMSDMSEAGIARGKDGMGEELAPLRDTPSPMSALEESDSELRSVQSQATTADDIALYPDGIIGSPYPKTRVRAIHIHSNEWCADHHCTNSSYRTPPRLSLDPAVDLPAHNSQIIRCTRSKST